MIKRIIQFATPIMITNFALFFCMMVNRIWAAKFLSTDSIAIISLANTILYIVLNLMIAVISASSSLIAQAYGGKHYTRLGILQINSIYVVMIFSLVFALLLIIFSQNILIYLDTPIQIVPATMTYLRLNAIGFVLLFVQMQLCYTFRSFGCNKEPFYTLILMVVINMILDPILMLGLIGIPRLGVVGAGYAALIAQFGAFMYIIYLSIKNKHKLYLEHITWMINKQIIKNITERLLQNIFQVLITSIGLLITQYYINQYGANSIAIFGALFVVIDGILYFAWSMSISVSVLAGQFEGAKDYTKMWQVIVAGTKIILVFSLLVMTLSILFPRALFLLFFNLSDLTSLYHEFYLSNIIIAVAYIFLSIGIMLTSCLNGIGLNKLTTTITLMSNILLRIPMVIILSIFYGVYGVWLGLSVTYIGSCLITLYFMYHKLYKKYILA